MHETKQLLFFLLYAIVLASLNAYRPPNVPRLLWLLVAFIVTTVVSLWLMLLVH